MSSGGSCSVLASNFCQAFRAAPYLKSFLLTACSLYGTPRLFGILESSQFSLGMDSAGFVCEVLGRCHAEGKLMCWLMARTLSGAVRCRFAQRVRIKKTRSCTFVEHYVMRMPQCNFV